MQMKDKQHTETLENHRQIEMAKLQAHDQDHEAKAALENQKMMHDRESHQVEMVESKVNLDAMRQKNELAKEQQQMKAQDMVARQNERQQQAAFKQQQAVATKGIVP
jgi:hypothetical protein